MTWAKVQALKFCKVGIHRAYMSGIGGIACWLYKILFDPLAKFEQRLLVGTHHVYLADTKRKECISLEV